MTGKKKTHVGEVVVDSHDLGAVEVAGGNKVDAVQPAVLLGVGLDATADACCQKRDGREAVPHA